MLKIAGDSNPADLFTKHLESRAKLDQLTALFHCKFLEGRPVTAPAIRQAGTNKKQEADVNQAADESILPHMCAPEEILKRFPAAVAHPAPLDEDDLDPVEELADPVPGIQAQRRTVRRIQAPPTTTYNTSVSSSSRRGTGTGKLSRRRRKESDSSRSYRAGTYIVEEERCAVEASCNGIRMTSNRGYVESCIRRRHFICADHDIDGVRSQADQEWILPGGSGNGPYTDRGAKGLWPLYHIQACSFVRSLIRQSGKRPGGVFMWGPYGSSVKRESFVFPNQPE